MRVLSGNYKKKREAYLQGCQREDKKLAIYKFIVCLHGDY